MKWKLKPEAEDHRTGLDDRALVGGIENGCASPHKLLRVCSIHVPSSSLCGQVSVIYWPFIGGVPFCFCFQPSSSSQPIVNGVFIDPLSPM